MGPPPSRFFVEPLRFPPPVGASSSRSGNATTAAEQHSELIALGLGQWWGLVDHLGDVLGEPFSEQNHMLNSTMKMVRGRIAEFYKTRLDALYTPEGRSILNAQNRAIVGRIE